MSESETVTYRCWCEHDGCEWEREVSDKDDLGAQNCASAAMMGHGIAEDHHRTKADQED